MHLPAALLLAILVVASSGFLFGKSKDDSVKITLYRRNVKGSKVDLRTLSGLASFEPKAMSYFIIHGWNGGDGEAWLDDMKNALLDKVDANVLFVNWGKWAQDSNYLKATAKCDDVGSILASFILNLEKQKLASRTKMHLIGHSLGGQIAGFTGSQLQSPKIARITGLDTSGIGFGCLFSNRNCLDSSDATFVDEIHSLISALPKGHADFYPIPVNPLKVAIETKIVRAHFLAIDYFIKSIQAGSCAFKSTLCSSRMSYMDGKCSKNEVNSVGFYAKKPSSKPPNNFFITIDIDKPC